MNNLDQILYLLEELMINYETSNRNDVYQIKKLVEEEIRKNKGLLF